jgi:hypothetical protein
MVILIVALATGILFGLASMMKARKDISHSWSKIGPGQIAVNLQGRNQVVAGVVAAIIVGIALLEAIIPAFHLLMIDFQYAVGTFMNAGPAAVVNLGTGGGISWGLYLAVFIAALAGTILGVKSACGAYGSTQGISIGQLI